MNALRNIDARVKLVCLAVYIAAALHAKSPLALGICLIVAMLLAAAVHLRRRDVRAVMRPLAPILVVTAIMQVLYLQQGQAIVQLGPVTVTAEALWATARMLASLLSVMLASVAFMRCTDTEELMRTLRWLLAPLRAAGLRTEGFMFSVSVAFRFIPVLVKEFRQVKRAQESRCGSFDGGVRQRLGAYMRLFPPLARSSLRRADSLAEASVSRCLACGIAPTAMRAGRFGVREAVFLIATLALTAVAFLL